MRDRYDELLLRDACREAVTRVMNLYDETRDTIPQATAALEVMCSELPERKVREPLHPAHWIGFDGTPLEISLRLGASSGPAVRFCVDAAVAKGTKEVQLEAWRGGRRIAERIRDGFGARLDGFSRVESIFLPVDSTPHRLVFACGPDPAGGKFQAYFSVSRNSQERVQRALVELGAPRFSKLLSTVLANEHTWLSVDLAAPAEARTKVYINLVSFEVSALRAFHALAPDHWPTDVDDTINALYGQVPEPLSSEKGGLILCYHVRGDEVTGLTFHFPTSPMGLSLKGDVLLSDGALSHRISTLMKREGIPQGPYLAALDALACHSLDDELCIHKYLSILREKNGERVVTNYLCPRFFAFRSDEERAMGHRGN